VSRRRDNIVVSYDIHEPQRLVRVGKIMKDYGERVLKSVFECNLSPRQFMGMKNRIDEAIDHVEDSVRFYFICDKCIKNVRFDGLGRTFVEEEDVIIT